MHSSDTPISTSVSGKRPYGEDCVVFVLEFLVPVYAVIFLDVETNDDLELCVCYRLSVVVKDSVVCHAHPL